jgi:hypothetical protein
VLDGDNSLRLNAKQYRFYDSSPSDATKVDVQIGMQIGMPNKYFRKVPP